jgi:hypothetical protein
MLRPVLSITETNNPERLCLALAHSWSSEPSFNSRQNPKKNCRTVCAFFLEEITFFNTLFPVVEPTKNKNYLMVFSESGNDPTISDLSL